MIDEIQRFERMAPWRGFPAALAPLGIRPGWRVLDVGCGSGAATRLIAGAAAPGPATGLDRNPLYVAAARQLARERAVPNVAFVAGDARFLPFGDRNFDCVWAAFVVEYLAAELGAVLRELARVVRPGGVVAIFDVDGFLVRHDPIDPDLAARLDRWRASALARGFDPEIGPRLPAALRAAGLRDVRARTFPDPELYPPGRPPEGILAAWEQRLAGMRGLPAVFGSEAEAARFRRDFLALLRRDDRRTIGANWLAWGKVAGG